MDDDFKLLERALAGDRKAWSELVQRHCPSVRRFFRTMVPPDAVDDLTQETFVRIEQAYSAAKKMTHFRPFLFGIARHVFHEYLRSRARDPRLELDDLSAIDLDPRPSTMLVKRADQALLLEGLRRLTLAHQIVLQLYYWEDLTAPQIAIVLDENENTIRGRITKARNQLRVLLAEIDKTGVASRDTDTDLDKWASARRHQTGDDDDDDA